MENYINESYVDALLSNLQVSIYEANYAKCPITWKDIDYIPDFNKFYFICGGEGWVRIGSQEFKPKAGQLFFMPEGVLQSYSCINDNPYLKYWIHFKAKIGEMNLFDVIKLPYYIDITDFEYLRSVFDELVFHYNRSEIVSKLMAKSKLYEILAYFIKTISIDNIQPIQSDSSDRLRILLDYINRNISGNISVDELAKVVYLHPNYLIKIFKNHFGMSPIHYINNKRIQRAKELLLLKNASITQISKDLGFSNVFYFSKIFKKYIGFSPSDFRSFNK